MTRRISNSDQLATTPLRSDALAIAEAAYQAIDTDKVVLSKLVLSGNTLHLDGKQFDLSQFSRIRVFGFGKASCRAVQTIEELMRERITDGIVIDVRPGSCGVVSALQGSHPHPSLENVLASTQVVEMIKDTKETDLVIVVVSGGGSSLLCYPQEECDQGIRLYDDAARVGATIEEMNLVRRHLSSVKGGGLAALLHPATVLGLVFCDVPGDRYQDVASGPTYFDPSTIGDAQAVLDRYGLTGYTLRETPKDPEQFARVHNVGMVSNTAALAAMRDKALELGYGVVDAGAARYDAPGELVVSMLSQLSTKTAVIAGGEVSLKVTRQGGKGGRCQYVGLEALARIGERDLFLPFASDGIDNTEAAGVIADANTMQRAVELGLSVEKPLQDFDTFGFFERSGALLFTGFTDSNVSDLYLALRS